MKKTIIGKYKLQTGLLASGLCLLAGGLMLLTPNAARAQDQNGTWLSPEQSGDWGAPTSWTGGLIANGAGYAAYFGSLGGGDANPCVVTLDSSRTIGRVEFTPNGRVYTLNPLLGTEVLTLAGTDPAPVRSISGGKLNMNVPLAGSVAIRTPNQASRIILNATNTYTGDTQVHRGAVQAGVPDAIPHGSGKGDVVMLYNFGCGGNGEQAILDVWTNDVTINALKSSDCGGTVYNYPQVTTSSADAGTSTLTVGDNNASGTFEGTIDESGSRAVALTKIGSGTQVLKRGANQDVSVYYTYSGATTVDAGTLQIDGSIGGGFATSPVTVNAGTICGNGEILGSVTILATGKISAGASASAGKLTLYGGLDMSAPNTTYTWHLGANSDSNPGVDSDQIAQAVGSADVTDANLNIQFTGSATAPNGTGFWANNHSWLIMSGTVTGNFKNIQNGTNGFGKFYTTVDGSGVTLNFETTGPVSPQPKITSIVPNSPNPTSVIVNYNNCVVGKTYFLQWKSPVTGGYTTIGSGKVAAGAADTQTDNTASGSQRYYRVYYVGP